MCACVRAHVIVGARYKGETVHQQTPSFHYPHSFGAEDLLVPLQPKHCHRNGRAMRPVVRALCRQDGNLNGGVA